MKGLIEKYILPRAVDFNAALQRQVNAARDTVADLCRYYATHDYNALTKITQDERDCRHLKNQNMHELLDVFITPYDRESIYRIINQLDWIALSVKHLAIDILIYKVTCPKDYQPIFSALGAMSDALADGFNFLTQKNLHELVRVVNEIYVNYDKTVETCALAAAKHLDSGDIKAYLKHREVLNQLKEVAKRINISANSLEDLAIKLV